MDNNDNLPDLAEKGKYRFKYRGTECLNCGHPLDYSDRYCPNCSQANSTKKLSLKDFLDEFFASFISYDSKLLKTLGALLLSPGKITRDYLKGKRVAYTNPFRFLLSLTIIYFLMINFTGNFSEWDKYGMRKDRDLVDSVIDLGIGSGIENDAKITREIDSVKTIIDLEGRKRENKERDSVIFADPKAYFTTLEANGRNGAFLQKLNFFNSLLIKDSLYNFNDAVVKYEVPETFENRSVFNIANGWLALQSRPGTFISTLISKLPFAVFFFLPVFTLFIWTAYIRKRYSYTDHLIFSFHNTALLFILLIISYLIDATFDLNSNWIFLMVFLIYLFQAMRKFYGQGTFKTIVKYLSLNAIFFVLGLIATVFLFIGNIFTF